MFVSGPPEQMFAFRSWSWTRLDQLWELCDTPGCVVRTGVRRRRHARIRWSRSWSCERANKWLCENLFVFFYFFSLPLYHKDTDLVKCFLENFLKKFSIFLLTCAGVSWYNVYVNGKGKENWLSRKKLEKVKKILDFSS